LHHKNWHVVEQNLVMLHLHRLEYRSMISKIYDARAILRGFLGAINSAKSNYP